MIDLFQDRRIFLNSKKKAGTKNILPEIKYSPGIVRKFHDDLSYPSDHSRMVYSYQPLSNILVSKRITPPNPEQVSLLLAKKKIVQNPIHNFKIRKESVKKISDKDAEAQTDKRNSTSLSHRGRKHDIELETQLGEEKVRRSPDELTFAVVKGNNNQELVREILLARKIWKQVKFGQAIPNLKWVFYKDRHNYKKMWSFTQKRVINHFEFSEQICTKDSLIRNLQLYCQTKKLQVFNLTPITFIFDFDDQYCEYNIKQFIGFFLRNDPRKQAGRKPQGQGFVSKFQAYMAWQNSDIKKKVNVLSKPVSNTTYYSENSYLWLLKPTGLNRGRGIQIFDSLDQLEKILLDYLTLMNRKKHREGVGEKTNPQNRSNGEKSIKEIGGSVVKQGIETEGTAESKGQLFKLNTCSFVVQKYVEKPMLIEGRKFDIRVWVLLTEQMNVYFFKQAYIRTSSDLFSTQDTTNYFIHLTNNAIQKQSSNYGQFQSGNQLPFRQLVNYIPQESVNAIWQKIKEVSFMVFSSVKKKINSGQRRHCFEVFGLDYIVDQQLKAWLIEVNQNPCIQCSSPLLGELIPRMLNDAFKLTVDLIFEKKPEQKAYPVKGYSDTENMWQNLGQLTPNGEYMAYK